MARPPLPERLSFPSSYKEIPVTTQIEPTTASAPRAQGTHFFVLTVEKPGVVSAMQTGTYTPRPGGTRMDAFSDIYQAVTSDCPDLRRANVVFFSLEPNQL
jgi:hypothetical protein